MKRYWLFIARVIKSFMRAIRMIIAFRLLAVIDVLFSERFELTTYKDGKQKSKTRFDKKEIKTNCC